MHFLISQDKHFNYHLKRQMQFTLNFIVIKHAYKNVKMTNIIPILDIF